MNVSEQVLWSWIRKKQLGFLFKRQVPIGVYVIDFYCPEASLAVEVDGPWHTTRIASDQARDAWLAEQGIEVLRLPSLDLFDDAGIIQLRWLDAITARCEERSGRKHWQPKPRKPKAAPQGEDQVTPFP